MTVPDRDQHVITPAATSSAAPRSAYAMRRIPRPEDLIRDDGSVLIPAGLADEMLRGYLRDFTRRARDDGAPPRLPPGMQTVLYALDAAQHVNADQAAKGQQIVRAPVGIEHSSDIGTWPTAGATVAEVSVTDGAARYGCSPEYVRRLARTGAIPARRIGARAWAIDAAGLDDYRHGRTPA